MEHQTGQVPENLKPEFDRVTEWLAEASIQLCQANENYQRAILARIALMENLYSQEH